MDLLYAVNQAQAQILADGWDKHLAHASSAELDAIVNDDRSLPVWSGEEWTNACPLVVNADVYDEPGLTPPTGNVVAVSAADDRAFLLSLARLGWIDVDETAN